MSMGRKRSYEDDDGRTIADMSGVSRQPVFLPRLPGRPRAANAPAPPAARGEQSRPWEETGLSKKEQLWYMLGALKAALLIALAFIGGLGLVVLLFVLAT